MADKKKSKDNKIVLITSIVVLAVCIAAGIFFVTSRNEEPSTEPPTVDTEPSTEELNGIINPLTGERGFSENAVGKRPVAFMINNAPAARPQWGLCTPDIVFEGLVEGGATRMMWVYADAEKIPEKVGSMRSARHDFLEVAESLDAIFVHWGGSTYAYDAIKARNPAHIDGIYIGSYSHRDNTRNTPIEHRGYLVGSEVRELIEKNGFRADIKERAENPFTFAAEERIPAGGVCNSVTVSFSSYYSHTFKYDPATGLYTNYMGSVPMTQDDGKAMEVKNVVILYTPVSYLNTDPGHVDMDLNGGEGVYAANGKYEKITWSKGAPYDTLKFYAEDGTPLELNKGKSWIGLVPKAKQPRTVIAG